MTILFDIGNVLLDLHFDRFQQAIHGTSTPPDPDLLIHLKDPYEAGEITSEEFVNRSLEIITTDHTPETFIAAWEDIFTLNTPMWDLVRELKQEGHRLILFSNTNEIHANAFLSKYPEFALFDHQHFSQNIGAIKPNDEFYQIAIKTYQLIPAETLYFDDLPDNIATGKRLGFQSHQYDIKNHQAALTWIQGKLH